MVQKRCGVTVLVALSLLVLIGGPTVASEELATLERSTWEAWANNDAAAYGRLLAEGHIEIGSGGITAGKDENIAGVESCDVRSYALGLITAQTLSGPSPYTTRPRQTSRWPREKPGDPICLTSLDGH